MDTNVHKRSHGSPEKATVEVPFDPRKAIGLAAAASRMIGRGGRHPNVETLRRWANPRRGCRPAGPDGPQIVLKVVRLSNELMTMPEWVEWFEAERVRLGQVVPSPRLARRPTSRQLERQRERENRLADQILARAGIYPARGIAAADTNGTG